MKLELTALCEKQGDNTYIIQSPKVGCLSNLPSAGTILNPGSKIGDLNIINTNYELMLPSNVSGQIEVADSEHIVKKVTYKETLFKLVPVTGATEILEKSKEKNKNTNGRFTLYSPSDGIFYRRPGPEDPCYVNVGDTVKMGSVLGLVEIMKCFNQITFEGNEFPKQAKIVDICVEDACEIKYNQPLFIFS